MLTDLRFKQIHHMIIVFLRVIIHNLVHILDHLIYYHVHRPGKFKLVDWIIDIRHHKLRAVFSILRDRLHHRNPLLIKRRIIPVFQHSQYSHYQQRIPLYPFLQRIKCIICTGESLIRLQNLPYRKLEFLHQIIGADRQRNDVCLLKRGSRFFRTQDI